MDGMMGDHGGGDNNGSSSTTQLLHGGMNKTTMMHMTFFWGKNAEILFSGWPGTRTVMYVSALIFVFVLAVIVEWLSHCQLLINKPAAGSKDIAAGFTQSLVRTIRVGLAYLLMLTLMSFNVGVFLVAVAGHFLGSLLFGSRVFKKTEAPLPTFC